MRPRDRGRRPGLTHGERNPGRAGTETDPPPEPTGDGGAAAHLHGPTQLFANVVALPTASNAPTAADATASVAHDTDAHDERGAHRTPAPTEPSPPATSPTSEEAS
jgi:hypothetical protein